MFDIFSRSYIVIPIKQIIKKILIEKSNMLFITGILLLTLTIFATDITLSKNITSTKRSWYYAITSFMIILNSFIWESYNNPKIKLRITTLDMLFFLFPVWITVVYNYNFNYSPHFLSITTLSLPDRKSVV